MDITGWQERMGLSDRQVAAELGISRTSWAKYKREGAPRLVELACTGLEWNRNLVTLNDAVTIGWPPSGWTDWASATFTPAWSHNG